jgi:hypothetical protein
MKNERWAHFLLSSGPHFVPVNIREYILVFPQVFFVFTRLLFSEGVFPRLYKTVRRKEQSIFLKVRLTTESKMVLLPCTQMVVPFLLMLILGAMLPIFLAV